MAMLLLALCILAAVHASVNGEVQKPTLLKPSENDFQKYARPPDVTSYTHVLVSAVHSAAEKLRNTEGITVSNQYVLTDVTILVIERTDQALQILQAMRGIRSVEGDILQSAFQCYSQDLTKIDGLWNLARTNWRDPVHYPKYFQHEFDGADTTVYLVDVGVFSEHFDFQGRVTHGYTVPSLEEEGDVIGHGTHCAGTILGTIFGAAKSAKMISVKVLDKIGRGRPSECIDGLNWILNDYRNKSDDGRNNYKAVVSMPLAYHDSKAINEIILEMYKFGLLTVGAAGNSGQSARAYSPASSPVSITVAASDKNNKLARFSNYDESVDIIAPGVDILSTDIQSNGYVSKHSGTSIATCLVTGAVLRFLSQAHTKQTPDDVRKWLNETSTKGVISWTDVFEGQHAGTPNRFLYQPCHL